MGLVMCDHGAKQGKAPTFLFTFFTIVFILRVNVFNLYSVFIIKGGLHINFIQRSHRNRNRE